MTPEVPYPLHKPEPPVSYVEEKSRTRRRWGLVAVLLLLLLMLVGLVLAVVGIYGAFRLQTNKTERFENPLVHFAHGSIGADEGSGLPYWVWKALPRLFPDQFNGRLDYSAFGFLYLRDADGKPHDLPLGISKRNYQGVDLVWFNCAVCHVGTWRTSEAAEQNLVAGMPANNFDIYRFIKFVLDAGVDERLAAETLIPTMQQAGAKFNVFERLVWKFYVIPRVREGFIQRRTRLAAFMAEAEALGAGPRRHVQSLQARADASPQRRARRRGALRRERLPGDLQSGSARRHGAALGRQQQVARRAQPLRRARRGRHGQVGRSQGDRARARLAQGPEAAAEPAQGRCCRGRARQVALHARLRRLPRLAGQDRLSFSRETGSAR